MANDMLFPLRDADKSNRFVIHTMAEGILVVSAAGTVLSSNARMAEIAGVPLETLVGCQVACLFRETSAPALLGLGRDRWDPTPVQLTVATPQGTEVPVCVTASSLDLDGQRVSRLLVTDATHHRRSEEARLFQGQLLDAAGDAIIVTDVVGTIIYVNQAAERLYGWERDELLGQQVTDAIPSDTTAEQAVEIMRGLAAGDTWSGEFPVRRKDGSEFPAFVNDTPVFDANGRLTAVIGISSDITERKQAEKVLADRERWFRTLVASSSDLIIVLDVEGKMKFANAATTLLLGDAATGQGGRPALEMVHPDDLDRATEALSSIVKTPGGRVHVSARARVLWRVALYGRGAVELP